MRITNSAKITGLMAGVAILAVSQAKADFSFDLNAGNSAISGFQGPYAHVNVALNAGGTVATITFTSLSNGSYIYNMGDGGTVGVNVNAASWTLGTITGSNSGANFTPGPYSDGGSGNEDGFGSFNQTINTFDGNTHSSTTVSFTLTDTSGTWASAADVLKGNAQGLEAAAHIFVSTGDGNNGNPATGFASAVPEPTTMVAGALLLLPFGASTMRFIRKNRTA
jgi:hypothetical protein